MNQIEEEEEESEEDEDNDQSTSLSGAQFETKPMQAFPGMIGNQTRYGYSNQQPPPPPHYNYQNNGGIGRPQQYMVSRGRIGST